MEFLTMGIMLVFVLMLNFAVLRPQRKRNERFALMVASVQPGSMIYAGGGIHGEVLELIQNGVILASGPARTHMEIDSACIEQVEGYDYKAERARQKALRATRTMGSGRRKR